MKTVRTIALVLLGLILLVALWLWLPITPRFDSQSQPAQTYVEAMTRLNTLRAAEPADLFPECHTQLLTHGAAVTSTIVLFHGIPSCPAQFGPLAQAFYSRGYNVLLPRLPHHGTADPMTTEFGELTAEDLVNTANEAIDIANGLGEEVTVLGFSTGGAMAAWAAQNHPEVDQTVLVSPFLSPRAYPPWMVRPLGRALRLLPNQFWWWDEILKAERGGPRYAYPRYSTHAMAEVMRLSLAVRSQAERQPPQSDTILVITNASARENVDNRVTAEFVEAWQATDATTVMTYEWPRELNLIHNYIDPAMPDQPANLQSEIHPQLIEMIQSASE